MHPQNSSVSKGQPRQIWELDQNVCSPYFHLKPQLLPFQGEERQHEAESHRIRQRRRSGHGLATIFSTKDGARCRELLVVNTPGTGWRSLPAGVSQRGHLGPLLLRSPHVPPPVHLQPASLLTSCGQDLLGRLGGGGRLPSS